ncbi:antibiotic biosynthesis monooxygenase [Arthrobacter alpinus]|uniref:Antibiotic biosynthesis monooxygenase n=2 Tax=Arthrobacter TaxID=1663 RepID=A0A0M4QQ86_9MICC|nr:antibiotic biosynthesis monooxygenase [Arthrobacter alpinus]
MKNINLTGQLICQSDEEMAVVTELLPRHIELARAELGCISFEVNQTSDPRVWNVSESFQDAGSFELHQVRVKVSDWGYVTAGIKRNYSVSGL